MFTSYAVAEDEKKIAVMKKVYENGERNEGGFSHCWNSLSVAGRRPHPLILLLCLLCKEHSLLTKEKDGAVIQIQTS